MWRVVKTTILQKMNSYKVFAPSAARTTTESFEASPNNSPTGLFVVNITAGATASDTITVNIEGYDEASQTWYTILQSAALDAVASTILRVGMDYTAASNTAAKEFLPRRFRVRVVKNNATSITYSIGANFAD